MTEWQENAGEEGRVAWAKFGEFCLQVSGAEMVDGEMLDPAEWQLIFCGDDAIDIVIVATACVEGDPTLDELKRIAVEGAAKWLDGLKAKLPGVST